jgi:hypothetical protein
MACSAWGGSGLQNRLRRVRLPHWPLRLTRSTCRPGVGGPRACLKHRRTRFDSGGRHSQHAARQQGSKAASSTFIGRAPGSSLDSKSKPAGINTLAACLRRSCSSAGSSTGFVNRGSSVRTRPGALVAPRYRFMGPWLNGRALGLHPRCPGSNPGGSTSRLCSSVG